MPTRILPAPASPNGLSRCPCNHPATPTASPLEHVSYPDYHPSYDTLSQLYADSSLIVLGTVGARTSEPLGPGGGSRSTVGGYPLSNKNEQFFKGNYQGSTIGIPASLFRALSLKVGRSYVFFLTQDTSTPVCTVGGLRGVFSYDPATHTLNRVDHDPQSRLPRAMRLTQLESQLQALQTHTEAAAAAHVGSPLQTPPPYCSSSATGLRAP